MVIRAATYGTENIEHGGENLNRRDPSSTYFKQFNQHIKPDTTMDEWISRQTTLITVARDKQSKTDFHSLVEYDANITEYQVNSNVLFTPPVD